MISLKHEHAVSSRKALILKQNSANLPVPGGINYSKKFGGHMELGVCICIGATGAGCVHLLKCPLCGHQQVISNIKTFLCFNAELLLKVAIEDNSVYSVSIKRSITAIIGVLRPALCNTEEPTKSY